MGDRIKFGPLWLRNYSREAGAGGGTGAAGGQAGGGAGTSSTASGAPGRPGTSTPSTSSAPSTSTSDQQQKSTIQLAKLRYGREEMLALYEKSIEAPNELKQFELLYNAREKPPIALSGFEDDGRGGGGSPAAPSPGGDRYAGVGRGAAPPDMRARVRNFVRPATGRNPDGIPFERERPGEESPYDPTRERNYTRRWQGPQQSWRRQTSREETDEWRAAESARPRSIHPDRDWSERGGDRVERGERGDRGERGGRENKGWNNNRRTWVGDTPSHDDLPEWAEEGSLACGGTFDSSGAFHGYSNDDTSIPKTQGDSSYQLIRSHTQGSFSRSKTVEEGSDEWWASEKAKKLSPKKFDANELKYKKQTSLPGTSVTSDPKPPETPAKKEASPPQEPEPPKPESRFPKPDPEEKQRFDMMMKRMESMRKEGSEERGNFKSVMINANNGLRQKHQNLVPVVGEEAARAQPGPQSSPQPGPPPHALKPTPVPPNSDGRSDKKQKNFDSIESFSSSSLSELTASHLNLHDIDFDDYFMSEPASSGPPNSSVTSLNTLLNLNPSSAAGGNMQQMGRMPTVSQPNVRMAGPSMMATTPSLGMRLGLDTPRHLQPRKPLTYSPRLLYSGQASSIAPSAREQPPPYSATMGPRMTSSLFMGPEGSIPMPGDIQNMQSQPPPSSQASMFPGQGMPTVWREDKIPMPGEMASLASQLHAQPPPSSQGALYGGQGLSPQPQSQPAPAQQFGASMYGGMLQQPPLPPGLSDMWYYEDPKQVTQGPFSAKEMYNWYRAGFFTSELMVRRACDLHMRPLGSYGSSIPFAPPDVPYQIPRSGFPGGHTDIHRFGIGDVMGGIGGPTEPDSLQFGNVARDFIRPTFNQQPMVESLWSQPAAPGAGDMWMPQQQSTQQPQQPGLNSNDPRVMFFWEQQSTGGSTGTILPDGKEMKTEDQILAQLRASQEAENAAFLNKDASKPEQAAPPQGPTPDFGELEKFIQKEALSPPASAESKPDAPSAVQPTPVKSKPDLGEDSSNNSAKSSQAQLKAAAEKLPKILKAEDKTKSKENGTAKSKKKNKEDKKDETADAKKEEDQKSGRKSEDSSPSKSKKEDKLSKKDLEKEKKEWLKEGFTIVKGSEKSVSKESKKKAEETKTAEEAERKRKEEEKLAAEEERKRKQAEALRRQQEQQQQQQARQALEAVAKKAPWSAVATPGPQGPSHEGLSLAEIQRLEREKKLEQMREQQAMMQLLAQQQQAALAREQEMQAGLGWAKKNASSNMPGQSLAEIQAEARKQAAAAQAAAQALEEALAPPPPVALNLPWGSTHNGGGFWDTERTSQIVQKVAEKPQPQPEPPKLESKPKKKAPAPAPVPPTHTSKKVTSPAHEFEAWCNSFLAVFSSKIDVPTFVGFLKDIESPFEVKEYVKCYLGESKDSNDFARQFLERRSKLLRAGTVTPVDDLCSPAAAINPRSAAGLDFQEGKAKKTKKNKMLKVDARILGFSVTASEDRINVGDIDSV